MHDPVVLTDGHTYERRHIEKWLRSNDTSPVSGAKLPQKEVFSNHALRNAIEEYFEHVLSDHRNAIRKATAALHNDGNFSDNKCLLSTIDSLMQCSILVNADLSCECVLKRIMEEAKSLVGAEVASVFLVDRKERELYSTVNSTGGELRIPMKSGVAGHVASEGVPLIIQDAYSDSRFNNAMDAKTGFKTRNILCVPIKAGKGGIIGVAQLINKTDQGALTLLQQSPDGGYEFTEDDQQFFLVLAAHAAAAIENSGMFELISPTVPSGRPVFSRSRTATKERSRTKEMVAPGSPTSSMPQEQSGKEKNAITTETVSKLPPLLNKVPLATVRPLLESAFESWELDTLSLAELTNNKPLSILAGYLFERHGFVNRFQIDIQKMTSFFTAIESGYPDSNQYHNKAHAASVLHFMHALLTHGRVAEFVAAAAIATPSADTEAIARNRDLVILAGLLAAVIHDYEHEGVTNDYLVNTANARAIKYNDRSPNENHHASAAFAKLTMPEHNFLEKLSPQEYREVRQLVLDMVLATDMTGHGKLLSELKGLCSEHAGSDQEQLLPKSAKQASLALQVTLKCADVGHLALEWKSHMRWVLRLEEEFFTQGDMEKAQKMDKISFLMDRNKPGVSQTQSGFFDFIVLPLFRTFAEAFPTVAPMRTAVEENYKRWQDVQKEIENTAATVSSS
jgi:hypothetical protein